MKTMLLASLLMIFPLASSYAMPVMEAEIHQKQCNEGQNCRNQIAPASE